MMPWPTQIIQTAIVLSLALFTGGCVHYEFDLVQSPNLSRHIPEDRFLVAKMDPLEYRMISYEDRLVMNIYNPTSDNIQLDGKKSSVVDPTGESHPMIDRVIPAGAYVKLILPPLRPEVIAPGPMVGIGVGPVGYVGPWPGYYYGPGYDPYYYNYPNYYEVYQPNDPYFWTWHGETDIRLILVYHRGNSEFRQEFMFHRQRM